MLTKEQIVFWLTKMTRLDLAQDSNRQRIVDTFVNSIYVHEDRAVINLNCCDDEKIVPFEVESGSFLSTLGEPRKARKHNVFGLLSCLFVGSDSTRNPVILYKFYLIICIV